MLSYGVYTLLYYSHFTPKWRFIWLSILSLYTKRNCKTIFAQYFFLAADLRWYYTERFLGGVYMIPEWISFQNDSHGLFHVYMDVLILEWKCCKSIDGSKTWVSWSAQPIHLLISVPERTRTSFTWHWWNVQTDFVLERKFGSDATTGMKSFWNDSFRNTILVSIM